MLLCLSVCFCSEDSTDISEKAATDADECASASAGNVQKDNSEQDSVTKEVSDAASGYPEHEALKVTEDISKDTITSNSDTEHTVKVIEKNEDNDAMESKDALMSADAETKMGSLEEAGNIDETNASAEDGLLASVDSDELKPAESHQPIEEARTDTSEISSL